MAEMILPGTYIDVRPEGLIAPGQITVGNIGVVGTAAKGKIGEPQLLGSMPDALAAFYTYDSWNDPASGIKRATELTLVRALELLFDFGASVVYAVRVASNAKALATYTVPSASGGCVKLIAKTEGTWANDGLGANVAAATEDAYVQDEQHAGSEAPPILKHLPKQSARNRVTLHVDATGVSHVLAVKYDGDPAPGPGEAQIDRTNGHLAFGDAVQAADKIYVSYLVDRSKAALVTLRLDHTQETYTVVDGNDLIAQLKASAWVDAAADAHPTELPTIPPPVSPPVFAAFKGGKNGEDASAADYGAGLDAILNLPAHIIVGAGQDDSFGNRLDAHCQKASTDEIKHDRIGIVGSKLMSTSAPDTSFDQIAGHSLNSDRIIFVAPGIKRTDTPTKQTVTLSGAYTAAAFAGFLSSLPAHVSSTNKTLPVDELEAHFDSAHLKLLLQNRVLALESRLGFHIVRGITTTTGSAFAQITTRRIVDYAKFGVRSAADPYIGLLNNERVRGALRATLNAFLANMVDDEMLTTYDVTVTATRPQEIQGIVAVTLVLQPVFSIDFIKVTMFLQ